MGMPSLLFSLGIELYHTLLRVSKFIYFSIIIGAIAGTTLPAILNLLLLSEGVDFDLFFVAGGTLAGSNTATFLLFHTTQERNREQRK